MSLQISHETAESVVAWFTFGQFLVAFVAAVVVGREYLEHKRSARTQLAQDLLAQIDTDEMLSFAVTSLDWGSALVIVPPSWRQVVNVSHVPYDFAEIADALRADITTATQRSPLRLLYRHAFVRLFNHLERVSMLVGRDPELVEELEGFGWVASRICAPRYAPDNEKALYTTALASWYSPEVTAFVKLLAEKFPEKRDPSRVTPITHD